MGKVVTRGQIVRNWIVFGALVAFVGIGVAIGGEDGPEQPRAERYGVTPDVMRAALVDSDDFAAREPLFVAAAVDLYNQDSLCSPDRFAEHGGWVRKAGASDIYFIVCGTSRFTRYYVEPSDAPAGYRLFQE